MEGDTSSAGGVDDGSSDAAVREPTATGGGTRPGSAPDDLPNVDGGRNFGWLSIAGNDVLSYEVGGADYRAVCAAQMDLLIGAGWKVSDSGYEMDVDGAMVKTLEKPGFIVMITCGANSDEGAPPTVSVALNRSKK